MIKQWLRQLPLVAPLLRSLRMTLYPNQSDRWRINERRFGRFLLHTSNAGISRFFVKVGANDGLGGDPCGRTFVESSIWRGILIEPVPYLVERLRSNYSDRDRFVVEPVAIAQQATTLPFYFVDPAAKERLPDLPSHFDMLGSFDRQHIVQHLEGRLEPFIQEVMVQAETLDQVFERNGVAQIDLLQIDTEGFDWQVLQSLSLDRYCPQGILIEHCHLNDGDRNALLSHLQGHSYAVWDCGNDYFAERTRPLGGSVH